MPVGLLEFGRAPARSQACVGLIFGRASDRFPGARQPDSRARVSQILGPRQPDFGRTSAKFWARVSQIFGARQLHFRRASAGSARARQADFWRSLA